MARTLVVDMQCMLHGFRRRQQKLKWHPCRVAVPVEIAETAALAAPEALVLSYERRRMGGRRNEKETVRQSVGGHDGCLWRPLGGPAGGVATFADIEAGGNWRHWRSDPFRRAAAAALPTHAEALSLMREVRKDTSDWAAARAARTAADLLLVDGRLHRRDIEPVWLVVPGPERVEVDFRRVFPNQAVSGIPFPIAARDRAESFAETLAKTSGVRVKTSGMRLESALADYLSATSDAAFLRMMAMAFATARSSIRRSCRGNVPESLSGRFAEFERSMAPGGDALRAAELLDGLECTALDFMDGLAYDGNGEPSRVMSGGWRRAAEAGMGEGVLAQIVGGEAARPELDAEDEDAIASLAI